MPWKESGVMDEKLKFLSKYLTGADSMSALCREFNISRKTGYTLIHRYERQQECLDHNHVPVTNTLNHAAAALIQSRVLSARLVAIFSAALSRSHSSSALSMSVQRLL